MREIKFRAWNKKTKKMGVNWDLLGLNKSTLDFEDLELMQYTGLKDKNGKEIYEGDIIQVRSWVHYGPIDNTDIHTIETKLLVEYLLPPKPVFSDSPSPYWSLSQIRNDLAGNAEYEVIGNIYENPELLK